MAGGNRSDSRLGMIVGSAIVLAAFIFLVIGGNLGKQSVNSDADLPPVSSPEKSN
jgi:hypothetical protein